MKEDIIVVSGVPRSGTSMIMAMLAAGGMQVVQDGEREADVNNPKGYYEDSRTVSLNLRSNWIGEVAGKVLKVTAYLLPFLPHMYNYRILFVERNIDEVLKSQKKMLRNGGLEEEVLGDDKMGNFLTEHVDSTKKWLHCQTNMKVLFLEYHIVLAMPMSAAAAIDNFLYDYDLSVQPMAEVVDEDLYRNRMQNNCAPLQHSDHCVKCLRVFSRKEERGWTLKKDGKLKDLCIKCMLVEASNGTP